MAVPPLWRNGRRSRLKICWGVIVPCGFESHQRYCELVTILSERIEWSIYLANVCFDLFTTLPRTPVAAPAFVDSETVGQDSSFYPGQARGRNRMGLHHRKTLAQTYSGSVERSKSTLSYPQYYFMLLAIKRGFNLLNDPSVPMSSLRFPSRFLKLAQPPEA